MPASPSSHRKFTKFTTLFLSFTIALCLLSSSPSRQCTASPVPKSLRQQRSIAQQVHHVQFGDESAHNTLLLIKKSIQKKRQAKASTKDSKKKLKKRQLVVSEVTTTTTAAAAAAAAADANIDGVDKTNSETLLNKIKIPTSEFPSDTEFNSQSQPSSSSSSSPSPASSSPSKKSHVRLFSAYETIVFSESQIPVFLSQVHSHRRPAKVTVQQGQQGKYLVTKNNDPTTKGQATNSDNDIIMSSEIGAEVPSLFKREITDEKGNENPHKSEDDKTELLDSDSNVNPNVAPVDPLSPPSETQDETSSSSSSSKVLNHPEHEYQNFAYMYHGCASSSAIVMILFSVIALAAYKIYSRRHQYQLIPTSSPSYNVTSFEISDSMAKTPRRASESSREDMSHFVGYNME
ncbi:hypothetical protein BGZ76_005973 [Entomortierella beljakovae]|nr:hypothetical protein BGZ76_005973 [Entomortierella beljakovae]